MSSFVVICSECGQGYVARKRIVNGYCPDCRKLAVYEAMRRARAKARMQPVDLNMALKRNVQRLVVVNDPLEVGRFRAGMRFGREEFELMMRYSCFALGTVLKDDDGRLYEYRGSEVFNGK